MVKRIKEVNGVIHLRTEVEYNQKDIVVNLIFNLKTEAITIGSFLHVC
jgi:hypothetical protein